MHDKGIMNPAQSDKDMVPDYDDGMLFFHSHSLWDAMAKLEKFYQCKIYGYLDIQESADYLCDFNAFDKDCEDYICDIDEVPNDLWVKAFDSAYDNIHGDYGWADWQDYIYDYIVENLSRKTNE